MSDSTPDNRSPAKVEPEKTKLTLEHAHTRPLTACFWDPHDRFVYWGAEDNAVHRFDLKTQQVIAHASHDSWVRAIGMSPDGQTMFSGGYDGRLIWWPSDALQPEPIRVVEAHQGWIRALAVSPNGRQVATCGNDRLVHLWDAASGALLKTFGGHEHHVYNVAFAPSGETLASCDLQGFVKLWDASESEEAVETNQEPRDLLQVEALYKYDTTFRADIGGARCMAYSTDGARLALGGVTNVTNAFAGVGDCAVVLLDVVEGKIAVQLEAAEKVRGTAWGIVHHPQGFWIGLSAGGGGGWLYFWRGDEAKEFFKLKLKNDGRGFSMSPDGSRLAVAHADHNLRIYSLAES